MSKILSFRVPDDLYQKIEEIARDSGMVRSEVCLILMKQAIEQELPVNPMKAEFEELKTSLESRLAELEGKFLRHNDTVIPI